MNVTDTNFPTATRRADLYTANCLKVDPTFNYNSSTGNLSFSNSSTPSNPTTYVQGLAEYTNAATAITNSATESIFGSTLSLSTIHLHRRQRRDFPLFRRYHPDHGR